METEYQVVYSYCSHSLAGQVNEKIECGWRPIGGIAVAAQGEARHYQAMTRTKLMPVKTGGVTWLPHRQDKSAHRLRWMRKRLKEVEWCNNGYCPVCKAATFDRPRTHMTGCWLKAEIDQLGED